MSITMAVGQAHFAPVLHGVVGDEDLCAFVKDEEVGAVSRGRALHRNCRLDDDGSITMGECLLLLPGKEIGQTEEQQGKNATEESHLAQPNGRGEEIEQNKDDGGGKQHERHVGPAVDAELVDQRAIPRDDEELRLGHHLVDGLCSGQLQVEAYVGIAWREQQSTLVGQDGLSDFLRAVVGVAEVVVDVGTLIAILEQRIVLFDGLLVIALHVGAVGIGLGLRSCKAEEQRTNYKQKTYQGFSFHRYLFFNRTVLLFRITCHY